MFGVVRKNPQSGAEERGFGLMVGGGLSTAPYIAQSLRVFIREEQAPAVARGWRTFSGIMGIGRSGRGRG